MDDQDKTSSGITRRRLITRAAQGAALIPLVSLTGQQAWAAEKISEDHGTAKALGYVHDAANVDTAKYPRYEATQFCDNCAQYKATEEGWGTCTLFRDYLVAAKGWCNVWVAIP